MSDFLDSNFRYNCLLAKALTWVLHKAAKKVVEQWVNKLLQMKRNVTEKEIRNEYMWFMLLMLQCEKLREPFLSPPPAELPPLRELVNEKFYEEVLIANDDNMSWLENIGGPDEKKKVRFKQSPPSKFYYDQPIPNEGIICYMAAFSDRRD